MDLLIGGRKDLGQSTGGKNLIRSRVVMFADLPGFKVTSVCAVFGCWCFGTFTSSVG